MEIALTALVIEDDDDVRHLLDVLLTQEGFQVLSATTAREAAALLDQSAVDLVTLDLGLPDSDGLALCRQLRATSDAYLLILSARKAESDKVSGLDAGADDYLTKPFSAFELVARVHALLRRPRPIALDAHGATSDDSSAARPSAAPHTVGALVLDPRSRSATIAGHTLRLTPTEFELIRVLAQAQGHMVSRDETLERVWGNSWSASTHLVDLHVNNLRRKLREVPGRAIQIRNKRGAGFALVIDPADTGDDTVEATEVRTGAQRS